MLNGKNSQKLNVIRIIKKDWAKKYYNDNYAHGWNGKLV